MVKKADIPKHLIETALRLAAERGWRELSLADVAAAAKLPMSKVYPVYRSKRQILEGLSRMVDAEVLAGQDAEDMDGRARDRLFDVMMRRFDALQPYKAGIGNVIYDQARDPLTALCSLCALSGSMALMLETAGISASGIRGKIRVEGLMAIYLAAMRVWLRDDSADMAKTMAALDGYLRRVEGLARRRPGRDRHNGGAEA